MKELKKIKKFIKRMCDFYGYDVEFVINVVGEEKCEVFEREDSIKIIKSLGVKEVVDIYCERIEFFTHEDEYMEISVM
jgi:hypothetical protein